MSWNDAAAFASWLSKKTRRIYRLPSEAEWEYATRAETVTPFWWGASISTRQANYDGNDTYGGGSKGEYRQNTTAVKSFDPNPWGLYQVHGNVREWTQDCWNANYNGAPTNGSAWTSGECDHRVLRGGSWDFNPQILRAAYRTWDQPDSRYFDIGFRLSQTLNP